MSDAPIHSNSKSLVFILPIMYSWALIFIYILFYLFDFINYVQDNSLNIFNSQLLLISVWILPVVLTIASTGTIIDRYPNVLPKLVFTSLLGSSVFLFLDLYSLLALNSYLMVIATFLFGFFVGIGIIANQTLYSIVIPLNIRNRAYSLVIAGSSLISLLSVSLFDSSSVSHPFLIPMGVVGILGLVISIIFLVASRFFQLTWVNDKWPTKMVRIASRPSVLVYFWSHTLIWTMLGLMIGSLAQIQTQNASTLQFLHTLFQIDAYKGFWMVVLFGALLLVIPAGIVSDILGRKTLIIFSTTGIVLASLVVAIFNQFLISTLIIGFSFACVHAFSSLWVDLASRDSIGRYNALNFQSLGLGFLIGFLVSFYVYLNVFSDFLQINIFIMLGLAVFASLPLFWISDSYPPLEFFLLLVTNKSGMPLFSYNFMNEDSLKVDLPLISGALTALSTFMTEATGEATGRLSLVRHGTHFILSDETESDLTAAIFANKNDPELQRLLSKFLLKFEEKYGDKITNWLGDTSDFMDSVNDAEEIFGHLISIRT